MAEAEAMALPGDDLRLCGVPAAAEENQGGVGCRLFNVPSVPVGDGQCYRAASAAVNDAGSRRVVDAFVEEEDGVAQVENPHRCVHQRNVRYADLQLGAIQ